MFVENCCCVCLICLSFLRLWFSKTPKRQKENATNIGIMCYFNREIRLTVIFQNTNLLAFDFNAQLLHTHCVPRSHRHFSQELVALLQSFGLWKHNNNSLPGRWNVKTCSTDPQRNNLWSLRGSPPLRIACKKYQNHYKLRPGNQQSNS